MKRILIFLAAAAALALSGCSRYESVKGDPLQAKIYTLDNGLKVYMTVNRDEPRIQASIAVRVGGKDDPSDNTGLAHYLEHMMFKGSELFGTQDYAAERPLLEKIDSLFEVYRTLTDPAEREALYAQIDAVSYEASALAIPNEYDKLMSIIGSEGSNAYTSEDVTCYIEEIPSNRIDEWARIQADRFRNCVFRGFHTELEAVYEEKNMSLVDDGDKAIDALNALLFPGHPYGTQTVIGTQDHLKNPSLKAIRHQKDTYYVPNNVAICLSGDFDPDQMVKTIRKYFSAWEPNPALPAPVPTVAAGPLPATATAEVFGQDAPFVLLGWKTPAASEPESELSTLVSSVLFNGHAGLVDTGCLRSQAILDAFFFPYDRAQGSMLLAEGLPKEGQTLRQVQALLLEQVAKLRSGDFPEELVEAAKANLKLRNMRALESNRSRAGRFVDSFINGTSWAWEAGRMARLEKVTKEDVVAWAQRYLTEEGYAVVYKYEGEDKTVRKIQAPKITPILTNRDKQSPFLAEIAAIEPAPVEPVFVDYAKDLTVSEFEGLPLLYKKNEKNDLATLVFRYDRGAAQDPTLKMAADYTEYLGSDRCSAEAFATRLYALACMAQPQVGDNTTSFVVSGLSENLPQALEAAEYQWRHYVPEEGVLAELKADELRSREDQMKNQRACTGALRTYVMYGPDYVKARTLSNRQLRGLTSAQVLGTLEEVLGHTHTILYYGPASLEEVKALLAEHHPAAGLAPLQKQYPVKQLTPAPRVFVAHYDSRQFSYYQYSARGEAFQAEEDPAIELFNEYYGGGMNAIVFQEMRESRALAYSAGAWLSTPSSLKDSYSFGATIASQNDKLRQAVQGFDEIIETLPVAPENLAIARQALMGKLRTQRVKGERVLYSYLSARELGLDQPLEKRQFEVLDSLTMEDLVATHEKWVKGRTYHYAVLGDTKDLDMAFLRTLGPVEVLPLGKVFGY